MIIRFQNLRGSEWFLIPHGNWIAVNARKAKTTKGKFQKHESTQELNNNCAEVFLRSQS